MRFFLQQYNRFPQTHDVHRGFRVGNWCNMQRAQKKAGVLRVERQQMLDDIGFLWTPQEDAWHNRYHQIKTFYNTHGRLPNSKDNKSFVVWFHTQRQDYQARLLTQEQVTLLREIGVNLTMSTAEQRWQDCYQLLCAFQQEHQALPQFQDVYQGQKIGSWLCEQRKTFRKGKLDATRQQLLEQIGVQFGEKYDLAFDRNLQLLTDYLAEFGEFPKANTYYKDFKLGAFCERVKVDFQNGKLSAQQITALQAVDFDFRKAGEIRKVKLFEKNYTAYFDFYKQHGKRPTSNQQSGLYDWYAKANKWQAQGKLSAEMQQKLQALQQL